MKHRERLVVCKTILLKNPFGFFSCIAARSCVSERCFFCGMRRRSVFRNSLTNVKGIGAKAVRAAQLQILISTQGFISGFFVRGFSPVAGCFLPMCALCVPYAFLSREVYLRRLCVIAHTFLCCGIHSRRLRAV